MHNKWTSLRTASKRIIPEVVSVSLSTNITASDRSSIVSEVLDDSWQPRSLPASSITVSEQRRRALLVIGARRRRLSSATGARQPSSRFIVRRRRRVLLIIGLRHQLLVHVRCQPLSPSSVDAATLRIFSLRLRRDPASAILARKFE